MNFCTLRHHHRTLARLFYQSLGELDRCDNNQGIPKAHTAVAVLGIYISQAIVLDPCLQLLE